MKKKLLLLLIILLSPFVVQAEEERHEVYSCEIECEQTGSGPNTYYSTDVIYENGKYTLSGEINNYKRVNNVPVLYYCKGNHQMECESVEAVLVDTYCSMGSIRGNLKLTLKFGAKYETIQPMYIGKDYTYENGLYTLKDYEEIDYRDISRPSYFSENYARYFICKYTFSKTCEDMYRIALPGGNIAGHALGKYSDIEDYYLYSDQYIKKDNQYELVSPKKIYPSTDIGETGYTCRSKEATCESLYRITVTDIFDTHDGGRLSYVNKLNISNAEKEKKVMLMGSEKIDDFFTKTELNNIYSSDESVAIIKNGELVLYKVGNTDLIYEDDFTYKVVHLTVTNDSLSNNPKTGRATFFATILGIILLISMIVEGRKIYN